MATRKYRTAVTALLAALVGACAGPAQPRYLETRDGVAVYAADWPCLDGRPDEAGNLFPSSDAYVDPNLLEWPTATPAAVGLDARLLEEAVAAVSLAPRIRSMLVIRQGRLVLEQYFHGARPDDARDPHSATKSLIALVTGIAIDDGYFSLETPMGELLPDETQGSPLATVSVEDVLAMQAGVEWVTDGSPLIDEGKTMIEAVLAAPRVAEPGTVFEYNSGLSNLLALALDRTVPGGLCQYAHTRLLTPLGIEVDHWHQNPEGTPMGGSSAFLTPRELARLGQFVLDGGRDGGRQLVSPAWLETMLAPRFELPSPARRFTGLVTSYALHWWIRDLAGIPVWNASGYGGQDVLVLPALDMVVVLTHDTAPDTPLSPAVPWDDLLRLFVIPATGNAVPCPCPPDLYRAHPDGSHRLVLAPHPGNDLASDWSPDGSQIVFHSFRDLNAELYLMNADGTGLRRLTNDWAIEFAPKFSPDGTRIAFMSDRGTYTSLLVDLHVMDLATGQIVPITQGLENVRSVDWSPDGERLVFVRGDRDGLGEMWTADLATGELKLMFDGGVGFPAWSPDGTTIAVEVWDGEAPAIELFDVATGELTPLGPGGLPSWSGNGGLVYATIDSATLVAYDLASGQSTVIGAMPYGMPSPDGEWIVFGERGGISEA